MIELKKVINEILLNDYPEYKPNIVVINNTIRINLAFKNEIFAKQFVDKISECIRQRLDITFIVFYNYIDGPQSVPGRLKFEGPNQSKENIEVPSGYSRDCDNRRFRIII